MSFKGTKEVAKLLGVNVATLSQAVWSGRIPEPERMGGSFAWTEEDINRASKTLLGKTYTNQTGNISKSFISLSELVKAIKPLVLGEITESDINALIKSGQIEPYKVVSDKPVFLTESIGSIARRFTLKATA